MVLLADGGDSSDNTTKKQNQSTDNTNTQKPQSDATQAPKNSTIVGHDAQAVYQQQTNVNNTLAFQNFTNDKLNVLTGDSAMLTSGLTITDGSGKNVTLNTANPGAATDGLTAAQQKAMTAYSGAMDGSLSQNNPAFDALTTQQKQMVLEAMAQMQNPSANFAKPGTAIGDAMQAQSGAQTAGTDQLGRPVSNVGAGFDNTSVPAARTAETFATRPTDQVTGGVFDVQQPQQNMPLSERMSPDGSRVVIGYSNGSSAQYANDGTGRIMESQAADGTKTQFLYDRNNQMVAIDRSNANGQLVESLYATTNANGQQQWNRWDPSASLRGDMANAVQQIAQPSVGTDGSYSYSNGTSQLTRNSDGTLTDSSNPQQNSGSWLDKINNAVSSAYNTVTGWLKGSPTDGTAAQPGSPAGSDGSLQRAAFTSPLQTAESQLGQQQYGTTDFRPSWQANDGTVMTDAASQQAFNAQKAALGGVDPRAYSMVNDLPADKQIQFLQNASPEVYQAYVQQSQAYANMNPEQKFAAIDTLRQQGAMSFNEDPSSPTYQQHQQAWKDFQTWLNNANPNTIQDYGNWAKANEQLDKTGAPMDNSQLSPAAQAQIAAYNQTNKFQWLDDIKNDNVYFNYLTGADKGNANPTADNPSLSVHASDAEYNNWRQSRMDGNTKVPTDPSGQRDFTYVDDLKYSKDPADQQKFQMWKQYAYDADPQLKQQYDSFEAKMSARGTADYSWFNQMSSDGQAKFIQAMQQNPDQHQLNDFKAWMNGDQQRPVSDASFTKDFSWTEGKNGLNDHDFAVWANATMKQNTGEFNNYLGWFEQQHPSGGAGAAPMGDNTSTATGTGAGTRPVDAAHTGVGTTLDGTLNRTGATNVGTAFDTGAGTLTGQQHIGGGFDTNVGSSRTGVPGAPPTDSVPPLGRSDLSRYTTDGSLDPSKIGDFIHQAQRQSAGDRTGSTVTDATHSTMPTAVPKDVMPLSGPNVSMHQENGKLVMEDSKTHQTQTWVSVGHGDYRLESPTSARGQQTPSDGATPAERTSNTTTNQASNLIPGLPHAVSTGGRGGEGGPGTTTSVTRTGDSTTPGGTADRTGTGATTDRTHSGTVSRTGADVTTDRTGHSATVDRTGTGTAADRTGTGTAADRLHAGSGSPTLERTSATDRVGSGTAATDRTGAGQVTLDKNSSPKDGPTIHVEMDPATKQLKVTDVAVTKVEENGQRTQIHADAAGNTTKIVRGDGTQINVEYSKGANGQETVKNVTSSDGSFSIHQGTDGKYVEMDRNGNASVLNSVKVGGIKDGNSVGDITTVSHSAGTVTRPGGDQPVDTTGAHNVSVQKGQTLWSVAKDQLTAAHGGDASYKPSSTEIAQAAKTIADANQLTDANRLKIGQQLTIPKELASADAHNNGPVGAASRPDAGLGTGTVAGTGTGVRTEGGVTPGAPTGAPTHAADATGAAAGNQTHHANDATTGGANATNRTNDATTGAANATNRTNDAAAGSGNTTNRPGDATNNGPLNATVLRTDGTGTAYQVNDPLNSQVQDRIRQRMEANGASQDQINQKIDQINSNIAARAVLHAQDGQAGIIGSNGQPERVLPQGTPPERAQQAPADRPQAGGNDRPQMINTDHGPQPLYANHGADRVALTGQGQQSDQAPTLERGSRGSGDHSGVTPGTAPQVDRNAGADRNAAGTSTGTGSDRTTTGTGHGTGSDHTGTGTGTAAQNDRTPSVGSGSAATGTDRQGTGSGTGADRQSGAAGQSADVNGTAARQLANAIQQELQKNGGSMDQAKVTQLQSEMRQLNQLADKLPQAGTSGDASTSRASGGDGSGASGTTKGGTTSIGAATDGAGGTAGKGAATTAGADSGAGTGTSTKGAPVNTDGTSSGSRTTATPGGDATATRTGNTTGSDTTVARTSSTATGGDTSTTRTGAPAAGADATTSRTGTTAGGSDAATTRTGATSAGTDATTTRTGGSDGSTNRTNVTANTDASAGTGRNTTAATADASTLNRTSAPVDTSTRDARAAGSSITSEGVSMKATNGTVMGATDNAAKLAAANSDAGASRGNANAGSDAGNSRLNVTAVDRNSGAGSDSSLSRASSSAGTDASKEVAQTVKAEKGQTLSGIAKDVLMAQHSDDPNYKPSAKDIAAEVQKLAQFNHISDPNKLATGQEIKIPQDALTKADGTVARMPTNNDGTIAHLTAASGTTNPFYHIASYPPDKLPPDKLTLQSQNAANPIDTMPTRPAQHIGAGFDDQVNNSTYSQIANRMHNGGVNANSTDLQNRINQHDNPGAAATAGANTGKSEVPAGTGKTTDVPSGSAGQHASASANGDASSVGTKKDLPASPAAPADNKTPGTGNNPPAVGNSQIGNTGNSQIGNAGNSQIGNAGNSQIGNAGNSQIGNAGNSQIANAGNSQIGNVGNSNIAGNAAGNSANSGDAPPNRPAQHIGAGFDNQQSQRGFSVQSADQARQSNSHTDATSMQPQSQSGPGAGKGGSDASGTSGNHSGTGSDTSGGTTHGGKAGSDTGTGTATNSGPGKAGSDTSSSSGPAAGGKTGSDTSSSSGPGAGGKAGSDNSSSSGPGAGGKSGSDTGSSGPGNSGGRTGNASDASQIGQGAGAQAGSGKGGSDAGSIQSQGQGAQGKGSDAGPGNAGGLNKSGSDASSTSAVQGGPGQVGGGSKAGSDAGAGGTQGGPGQGPGAKGGSDATAGGASAASGQGPGNRSGSDASAGGPQAGAGQGPGNRSGSDASAGGPQAGGGQGAGNRSGADASAGAPQAGGGQGPGARAGSDAAPSGNQQGPGGRQGDAASQGGNNPGMNRGSLDNANPMSSLTGQGRDGGAGAAGQGAGRDGGPGAAGQGAGRDGGPAAAGQGAGRDGGPAAAQQGAGRDSGAAAGRDNNAASGRDSSQPQLSQDQINARKAFDHIAGQPQAGSDPASRMASQALQNNANATADRLNNAGKSSDAFGDALGARAQAAEALARRSSGGEVSSMSGGQAATVDKKMEAVQAALNNTTDAGQRARLMDIQSHLEAQRGGTATATGEAGAGRGATGATGATGAGSLGRDSHDATAAGAATKDASGHAPINMQNLGQSLRDATSAGLANMQGGQGRTEGGAMKPGDPGVAQAGAGGRVEAGGARAEAGPGARVNEAGRTAEGGTLAKATEAAARGQAFDPSAGRTGAGEGGPKGPVADARTNDRGIGMETGGKSPQQQPQVTGGTTGGPVYTTRGETGGRVSDGPTNNKEVATSSSNNPQSGIMAAGMSGPGQQHQQGSGQQGSGLGKEPPGGSTGGLPNMPGGGVQVQPMNLPGMQLTGHGSGSNSTTGGLQAPSSGHGGQQDPSSSSTGGLHAASAHGAHDPSAAAAATSQSSGHGGVNKEPASASAGPTAGTSTSSGAGTREPGGVTTSSGSGSKDPSSVAGSSGHQGAGTREPNMPTPPSGTGASSGREPGGVSQGTNTGGVAKEPSQGTAGSIPTSGSLSPGIVSGHGTKEPGGSTATGGTSATGGKEPGGVAPASGTGGKEPSGLPQTTITGSASGNASGTREPGQSAPTHGGSSSKEPAGSGVTASGSVTSTGKEPSSPTSGSSGGQAAGSREPSATGNSGVPGSVPGATTAGAATGKDPAATGAQAAGAAHSGTVGKEPSSASGTPTSGSTAATAGSSAKEPTTSGPAGSTTSSGSAKEPATSTAAGTTHGASAKEPTSASGTSATAGTTAGASGKEPGSTSAPAAAGSTSTSSAKEPTSTAGTAGASGKEPGSAASPSGATSTSSAKEPSGAAATSSGASAKEPSSATGTTAGTTGGTSSKEPSSATGTTAGTTSGATSSKDPSGATGTTAGTTSGTSSKEPSSATGTTAGTTSGTTSSKEPSSATTTTGTSAKDPSGATLNVTLTGTTAGTTAGGTATGTAPSGTTSGSAATDPAAPPTSSTSGATTSTAPSGSSKDATASGTAPGTGATTGNTATNTGTTATGTTATGTTATGTTATGTTPTTTTGAGTTQEPTSTAGNTASPPTSSVPTSAASTTPTTSTASTGTAAGATTGSTTGSTAGSTTDPSATGTTTTTGSGTANSSTGTSTPSTGTAPSTSTTPSTSQDPTAVPWMTNAGVSSPVPSTGSTPLDPGLPPMSGSGSPTTTSPTPTTTNVPSSTVQPVSGTTDTTSNPAPALIGSVVTQAFVDTTASTTASAPTQIAGTTPTDPTITSPTPQYTQPVGTSGSGYTTDPYATSGYTAATPAPTPTEAPIPGTNSTSSYTTPVPAEAPVPGSSTSYGTAPSTFNPYTTPTPDTTSTYGSTGAPIPGNSSTTDPYIGSNSVTDSNTTAWSPTSSTTNNAEPWNPTPPPTSQPYSTDPYAGATPSASSTPTSDPYSGSNSVVESNTAYAPQQDPYTSANSSYGTSNPTGDPYSGSNSVVESNTAYAPQPTADPYSTPNANTDPYANATPTSDPYTATNPYGPSPSTDSYTATNPANDPYTTNNSDPFVASTNPNDPYASQPTNDPFAANANDAYVASNTGSSGTAYGGDGSSSGASGGSQPDAYVAPAQPPMDMPVDASRPISADQPNVTVDPYSATVDNSPYSSGYMPPVAYTPDAVSNPVDPYTAQPNATMTPSGDQGLYPPGSVIDVTPPAQTAPQDIWVNGREILVNPNGTAIDAQTGVAVDPSTGQNLSGEPWSGYGPNYDTSAQYDPYSASKSDPYSANNDSSISTPAQDPYAAPKEDPYAAPKEDPYAAPKPDPYAAPKEDPYAAPKEDPYAAPKEDPYAAPKEDPYAPKYDPYAPQANGNGPFDGLMNALMGDQKNNDGKPVDSSEGRVEVSYIGRDDEAEWRTDTSTKNREMEDRQRLLEEEKQRRQREQEQKEQEEKAKKFADAMLAAMATRKQQEEEAIRNQKNQAAAAFANQRQKYVVLKGDTLESIAVKKLRNKRLAQLIYEINKRSIPYRMENGKKLLQLKPRMIIFLPSPNEVRRFETRLFGRQNIKFEYDTTVSDTPERASNPGLIRSETAFLGGAAAADAAESGHEQTIIINSSMEPGAGAPLDPAAAKRRANIEKLLGPMAKEEPKDGRIRYNCRLGDSLRSVAMRHPALKDVTLWRLVAEVNKLSTATDEKGVPVAQLKRGTTILLPTAAEISAFRGKHADGSLPGVPTESSPINPVMNADMVTKECPQCKRLTTGNASICPACAFPFDGGVKTVVSGNGNGNGKTHTNGNGNGHHETVSSPLDDITRPVGASSSQYETHEDAATNLLLAAGLKPVHEQSKALDDRAIRNVITSLTEESRIVSYGNMTDDAIGFRTRLEVRREEFWLPVVRYEINEDASWRHEFNANGTKKTTRIDLPPKQAKELAENDLSMNATKYAEAFLAGRNLND